MPQKLIEELALRACRVGDRVQQQDLLATTIPLCHIGLAVLAVGLRASGGLVHPLSRPQHVVDDLAG
jgi:hypothetical protein